MAVAQPRAVEAEPLAELDDLQRRLVARARVGGVEQPDGEEAQLAQVPAHRHGRLGLLADLVLGHARRELAQEQPPPQRASRR